MSTTFELSKRLYELRPELDAAWPELPHYLDGVIRYKNLRESDAIDKSTYCPAYTLEYLLERLPTDDSHRWYLQRWNNIDYAATYQDILSSNLDEQTICHAPTPLEAVLKLTVALIEAGLMPEGGKAMSYKTDPQAERVEQHSFPGGYVPGCPCNYCQTRIAEIEKLPVGYAEPCPDPALHATPTSADSLNLSKSKGLKPAKDFDPSQVTLCPGCNQMTHTIMSDTKGNEDYCGKCGKVKPADNSDSGRPEKLGGPQTRDFAAEAKQVEKILNRPHEPDYQCTQCSKSPAEHTTAGAGDTPTKTEN